MYDLAGVTAASVKVYLNGTKIKVDNFKQYCELYLEDKAFRVFESSEKWDVCIAAPDGKYSRQEFTHVSFVNSINTIRGGTHVEMIAA